MRVPKIRVEAAPNLNGFIAPVSMEQRLRRYGPVRFANLHHAEATRIDELTVLHDSDSQARNMLFLDSCFQEWVEPLGDGLGVSAARGQYYNEKTSCVVGH